MIQRMVDPLLGCANVQRSYRPLLVAHAPEEGREAPNLNARSLSTFNSLLKLFAVVLYIVAPGLLQTRPPQHPSAMQAAPGYGAASMGSVQV